MRREFHHPWWVHIPAGVLIIMGTAETMLLTGRIWSLRVGIGLLMSTIVLGVSVFVDDWWASREKAKRYNWFSLLDEFIIGWMYSAEFLMGIGVWLVVGGIGAAAILEFYRPYLLQKPVFSQAEARRFTTELIRRFKSGQTVVYWETHRAPIWIAFIILVSTVVQSMSSWISQQRLFIAIWSTAAVIGILVYLASRVRTVVTREQLVVTSGFLRRRNLALNPYDITDIDILEGTSWDDYKGYIQHGTGPGWPWIGPRTVRYVKISVMNGYRYLIGSDHPDRLAAAIRAMKEAADETKLKAE